MLCDGRVLDLKQVLGDRLAVCHTGNVNGEAAGFFLLLSKGLSLLLRRRCDGSLHYPTILLEGRAELLPVEFQCPLLPHIWRVQLLAHNQRCAGLVLVHRQIVGRTVSTADTLDPAVRCEELGVPAVASVVGHLVGHVLSETNLAHVDTNLCEEQMNTCEEVAKGLIVHNLGLNCLANGHGSQVGLAGKLGILVQQRELNVLNLGEPVVLLATLGINKVLDLSHQEFSHAQQTSSRRNFVSVRLANRGRRERHVAHVELEQLGEVGKLTLGCFWSQVASQLAGWTDRSLEHQIEWYRGRRLNTSLGVLELVLGDQLAKFVAIVVVDLSQHLLVLLDHGVVELDGLGLDLLLLLLWVRLFLLHRLATRLLVALQPRLEYGLDKVVRPQDLAVLGVLAHPIGKLVDVATRLEDLVGGQDGAVDLEHVLLEHKVLPPCLDDVCLQTTAGGTVVKQASNTPVNLEGRSVEHAPTQHGLHGLPVNGLAGLCREGRHVFLA